MIKNYPDIVVKIPAEAHIAYSSKRVYLIVQKNYRRDKGYNQDSRKVIGTYINPGEMHPNANFKEFYPAQWEEATKTSSLPGNKKIGIKAATTAIVEKEGIRKDLESVFGIESSDAILDYAMYAIENHSDVTEQFQDAMTNRFLFSDKVHDNDWYGSFFNKGIKSADCTKFKNGWAKHCKDLGYEDVYLCFDGSNNDCQAEHVEIAEKGCSKSGNNVNLVSYMYAVASTDCMPIAFNEYRGGEVDSKAIMELVTFLTSFGFKIKGAIIDRFFCAKPVLDFLESKGIEYIVLLTSNVNGKTVMMSKYAEKLKWNVANYIRVSEIFGITDTAPIFKNSKHDSFIHLYFDWKNGGERAIKLLNDTYVEYENALSKIEKGELPQIDNKYKEYISVRSSADKYEVVFNHDNLQKVVNNKGFSAIATSEQMTAEQADSKYRSRDNSEVCYKFVKKHLGFETTRVYSENSVRSKLFICFLASIIRNHILQAAKRSKISTNLALREISLLEARLLPDDNYIFIHNENNRQKALMNQLCITDEIINEIITGENNFNHGIVQRRRRRKPGPKKGSHNNKYDDNGNTIARKPGPKPGSHHATIKLKKDGTPKQKPGPKPGSKHKTNLGN